MTVYLQDADLTLYCGDALTVLRELPDESVHCVVTSPPYWGLRDYGAPGQLGLEPTPEEYVARMVEVFREVRRVLRADGTLWLNLGDSYAGGGRGGHTTPTRTCGDAADRPGPGGVAAVAVPVPWLFGEPGRRPLVFRLRADQWKEAVVIAVPTSERSAAMSERSVYPPDRLFMPFTDDPRAPHWRTVENEQRLPLADHECAHGRLAGDRTPPCGCWPEETRRNLESLYRMGVRDVATRAAHAAAERRRVARTIGRPTRRRERCTGCQAPLHERSVGCRHCYKRHWMREARTAA